MRYKNVIIIGNKYKCNFSVLWRFLLCSPHLVTFVVFLLKMFMLQKPAYKFLIILYYYQILDSIKGWSFLTKNTKLGKGVKCRTRVKQERSLKKVICNKSQKWHRKTNNISTVEKTNSQALALRFDTILYPFFLIFIVSISIFHEKMRLLLSCPPTQPASDESISCSCFSTHAFVCKKKDMAHSKKQTDTSEHR